MLFKILLDTNSEYLFDTVYHLNKVVNFFTDISERLKLAELNLAVKINKNAIFRFKGKY